MTTVSRSAGMSVLICVGLAACGGGGGEEPVNVDYSALRVADSLETPLEYARNDEQILQPLRNGVRLMTGSVDIAASSGAAVPSVSGQSPHSETTVQVEGVDEADAVKYDGRYIYSVRPELLPASSTTPQWSRNVLDVTRTDPATAGVEPVSKFVIDGEQSTAPLLYQLRNQGGAAEYLVAVSQNFRAWLTPLPPLSALALQPDSTTIQLLDVRDPHNVAEAWKLELDGWLRATRQIGDMLYVVTSYRPRVRDLLLPADTVEKRETNERRIRSSSARELLPGYAENGGARRQLAAGDGCLTTQDIASNEGYTDLVVISAINVRARRVTDVNCVSTNVNGVFLSAGSLYIAGTGFRPSEGVPITVLHKFVLNAGDITYRATGAVPGTIAWTNASYFMDEYEGDLRILTTANGVHRLTVLRESADRHLAQVSRLPNATRPAPIGKPGESVQAVRFTAERAYVVTFRVTDPFYVIDLRDPADPAIAGELTIPGFSTYLRPVGASDSEMLLAVGQDVSADGRREGVKVQLFDVRDIAHPQSLGAETFGRAGTWSEGLSDPHALTFLTTPGIDARYRLALPIHVYDTAHPTETGRFNWTYSGLHVLEVSAGAADVPELHFRGAIRTEVFDPARPGPAYVTPERGVLHGDSVFSIHGEQIRSSLWQDLPNP
jgi:hypothetical protein